MHQEAHEREKVRKEKLAGYYYDVSKLCLGSFVIGVLLNRGSYTDWILLGLGIGATIFFAFVGNKLLK